MNSARRWSRSRSILFLMVLGGVSVCLLSYTFPEDPPMLINLSSTPPCYVPVADPEPYGDFPSLTIPMKRAGRLLLIEAVIDGVQGNLVFDTGATGLVLNRTYFRKHTISESIYSSGITGTANTFGATTVEKVEISDLYYKDIKADVADLSHIENLRGIKVIGLLGFNMIRKFEAVIDIDNNELQLHRVDRSGERLLKADPGDSYPYIQKIDPWHPVLIVKGKIGGKLLSFCLDTGAEINAINSNSHKNVLATLTITRRTDLRGVGQASQEVLFGIMNDFTLGDVPVQQMETIVTNLNGLRDVYNVQIDGMLGFDFLQRGVVMINLAKRQFGVRFNQRSES
jgi:predicted aspartyl protease